MKRDKVKDAAIVALLVAELKAVRKELIRTRKMLDMLIEMAGR